MFLFIFFLFCQKLQRGAFYLASLEPSGGTLRFGTWGREGEWALSSCLPCYSTTVAFMGTTEANSRVKLLENIALQPSPNLQQCSCSDVRYKALSGDRRRWAISCLSQVPRSSYQPFLSQTDTQDQPNPGTDRDLVSLPWNVRSSLYLREEQVPNWTVWLTVPSR